MRFQVPQNIDLEDRLIGPLTLWQFVYLLIGGSLTYLVWKYFPLWLFWVLGVPLALLTLAISFIKIQDQPFGHFLRWLVFYLIKPKTRLWQKKDARTDIFAEALPSKTAPVKEATVKKIQKQDLYQLAKQLDKTTQK